MSVVEGMSAGNIPVLLNQGGLREIVHTDSGSEPFGHLCDTLDDFVRHTIDVFELPTERKRVLQRAARARGTLFDKSFTHAFLRTAHGGSVLVLEGFDALGSAHIQLPTSGKHVAVIVETRADITTSLAVKNNLLMLPCEWRLHVFYGTLNGHTLARWGALRLNDTPLSRSKAYGSRTSQALRDVKNVKFTELEVDEMDEVEYSGLLKSEFFWSALDAEHGTALVFRPNSLLLRPGIEAFVERKHAYIGAPWPPGDPVYRGAAPLPASATPSGGGLSLRSVDAMLACVANFARESPSDEPEDVFFVLSLPSLRQLMPTLEETMEFAIAAPASIATGDTPLGMTPQSIYGTPSVHRVRMRARAGVRVRNGVRVRVGLGLGASSGPSSSGQ